MLHSSLMTGFDLCNVYRPMLYMHSIHCCRLHQVMQTVYVW